MRRQIFDCHSARADGRSVPNFNSWDRDAADAHENAFAQNYLAGKMTTRSHVCEISQRTVVVNGRSGIDDAMLANDGVGLDDGSSKNNRAGTHRHRCVDAGVGMHHR